MRPISAEASRGKSHLTFGTSKGSFPPLLQLKKFPDTPVSTREEAREPRPHPEEPLVRLLAREEGSFPCVFGQVFPVFPSHLKRRHSPQKGERKSRVVPPFPESARCLSPFHGNLFSLHCLDFQAGIDSHLGGTWNSPVGKPRAKATDPLIHAKGSVTLLLLLERKAQVHAPTRDKD